MKIILNRPFYCDFSGLSVAVAQHDKHIEPIYEKCNGSAGAEAYAEQISYICIRYLCMYVHINLNRYLFVNSAEE